MGRQKKGRGSQGELLKWLHRRREGNDEKIFLTLLSPGIQNSSVFIAQKKMQTILKMFYFY